MRLFSILAVLLLASASSAQDLFYNENEQASLKSHWPKSIPIPEKLAFYRTSRWVQRSAVTDFPQYGQMNVLTVGLLPRPEGRWRVPGGLETASGWYSYRAVIRGAPISNFEVIEPASGAFGGRLRRIERRFTGATFFDLLLNADFEPFELRAIDVDGDHFDPMIVWRSPQHAPSWYRRPSRRACIDCHSRAGESAYATGNVPGAGGIFSYPVTTED